MSQAPQTSPEAASEHTIAEGVNNVPQAESQPTTAAPISSTTRGPHSTSPFVSPGSSFNSPWVIQEKPELVIITQTHPSTLTNDRGRRAMRDEDINSSRIFELYKLHSVQHELREGDTWVFVDFPAPPARAALRIDCYGTAYGSRDFRVHSEKLLATGSSVFKDLLGPTRQFRTLRRRKLVNKLPEGVKYVLDLTPPQEGDDLVFQMTELSLTPGIIKWWMADILHGVDSCLVNGHDDICTCMREGYGTSVLNRTPTSPTAPTIPTEDTPEEALARLSEFFHPLTNMSSWGFLSRALHQRLLAIPFVIVPLYLSLHCPS